MAFKVVSKIRKPRGNQEQYLVALDIGTEFVKALTGRVNGNQVEIIGVGRQRQRLTDMQSGAVTDIAGVVDNCDAALKQAEEMAGVVAKDTVMGIAGELVKGTSTTIKYKRTDSQTRIEMSELRQILDRVQERAFERARETLAWETGQQEIDVKMVNTAIVDVQIDGYRVTNPIGFQGRDVSIQLFNAFAPMVHIGALQQVGNNLDLNVINIAAEPFAVAKSVGGEDAADFSAIFIDIGGGTTDIALVDNGGVEGTKMFGIGGRTFTKRIASVAGVPFEQAEEMKLDYSAGKLAHVKDREAVEEAVNADIKVWLSGVELSLSEFTKIDHLPARILLCGGGTGLPQIMQALKGDWYKNLPFARKPMVSHIEPSMVSRVKDMTGKLTSYADITPMGLANLGLDVINTGSLSESILQKLSKTLQN